MFLRVKQNHPRSAARKSDEVMKVSATTSAKFAENFQEFS
jgi:hypothetical protein